MSTRTSANHAALAHLLFVSPANVTHGLSQADTVAAVKETTARLGVDAPTLALAEVAAVYGDYPETAAPRMTACLIAVRDAFGVLPIPAQRQVTR